MPVHAELLDPAAEAESADAAAERALALHRAGDLGAAEPIYRAVLARDSRHFGALHLLGLLRATAGDPEGGVVLMRRAIAADPRQAFVHSNLGNTLGALGRAEEALAAFDGALALDPCRVEALIGRGNALHDLGHHAGALASHDLARALGADMAELHNNRGNVLRALSRPEEALAAYDTAIERNPVYADAHANRATALADLHREVEALTSVIIALALRPDHPRFLNIQGILLRALDLPGEALAVIDRAIALSPGLADAHAGRATVLSELGRHEEALASAEEAIRLDPRCGEAWNGRGNALVELGREREALDCFDRAEALHPGNRTIHYNRGNALRSLGLHEEAVARFDEALAVDPAYADAHWNRALSQLALGDLGAGFAGYEWRWRRKGRPLHRHAGSPAWDGGPMTGRTLLLHAEQGLGDTIQMLRYLPLAARSGARLVLEVQRPLLSLLHGLPGIAGLVASDDPAPPHDAQCPLMTLPHLLGTALDTIPPPPRLPIDPDRVAAWDRDLPREGLRIGLACSGNPQHRADRHRSVPLSCFAPLLGPGIGAFLIQTDMRPEDAPFLATSGITGLRPRLTDFTETVAALLAMDAVVCVDTSVAHLAGTLGRPVHLLLPALSDWRWMLNRTDTPWYPSMTLHRRARDEGWEEVIGRVAAALRRA